MESLTLSEIAKATNGYASGDAVITDICTDTRKITKGCLFVCLIGERFDAHNFVCDASKLGAGALLINKKVETSLPTVMVDDTAKALLMLSGYYRSKFDIPLVGLTGSVGKTTTKEFVHLVLSAKYNALKTQGNMNNEIGMPQMLFKLDKSVTAAVIEMGMNHFGEIHNMVIESKPTIGLITNIGVSHIENLGSRQGILKAKLELLDGMDKNAPLVINSDNDLLAMVKDVGHPIIRFGINSGDFRAKDIVNGENSTTFTVSYYDNEQIITIPTVGEHNIYNALAAFAVGYILDINAKDAANALANYVPEGMRQKKVNINGVNSIEDCYNASPDSMNAALKTLSLVKSGKRIAVLADMLELGDYSKTAHSDVGKMAAINSVDYLLTYGELAKYYVNSAKENGLTNSYHFGTKEELADKLLEITDVGDTVLFKGSRGMKLEDVMCLAYKRWENK